MSKTQKVRKQRAKRGTVEVSGPVSAPVVARKPNRKTELYHGGRVSRDELTFSAE